MSFPVITLTTDFGWQSGYAGTLKGVIFSYLSNVQVVDLTHDVAPQNVLEGAFLFSLHYPYFPIGSVHIGVVDPGVGTSRQPVCLFVAGVGYFLAPDNGLLSYLLERFPAAEARSISNPAFQWKQVSNTFHGRDIFAPCAARLAGGASFEEVGEILPLAQLTRLSQILPQPLAPPATGWHCRLVHADRFGNLITNLHADQLNKLLPSDRSQVEVQAGSITLRGIHRTYGDFEPGTLLALIGSAGFLEISCVNGSATSIIPLESSVIVRF